MIKLTCFLLVFLGMLLPNFTQSKPNIVFIMADDLGYGDVGFNGSKWFETPNLDRIAAESKVFKYSYMYPTCSPSRTALLTGRQSPHTQVWNVPVLEQGNQNNTIFSRWTVEEKYPFYSAPLKEAGYKLIHIGKWHTVGPNPDDETSYPYSAKLTQPGNGNLSWLNAHKTRHSQYYPVGKGFHQNVGGTWWGDPARGHQGGYGSASGGFRAPFKNPFIEEKVSDEWLTDRLTDEAIDFIDKNSSSPFFVNLHYYAPHRPSIVRSDSLRNYFQNKPTDAAMGQGPNATSEIVAYATMVQSLDENVGRLYQYLDEQELLENTVFIFTSDNGHNGLQSKNDKLRGAKGNIYEGGIRVPTFVHWKGRVPAGLEIFPIAGWDWFPTFLEFVGIRQEYEGELDGVGLISMFAHENPQERPIFWHLASEYKNPPSTIIRKGDYKLIQFLRNGSLELYNLEESPKESDNIVGSSLEIKNQMLNLMKNWRIEHGAPLPNSASVSDPSNPVAVAGDWTWTPVEGQLEEVFPSKTKTLSWENVKEGDFVVYDLNGKKVGTSTSLDLENKGFGAGVYFVKNRDKKGRDFKSTVIF